MHIFTRSHTHTYIIPCIQQCVSKTIGCGISCNYTKHTNFLQHKLLQTFYKTALWTIFAHKKFIYRVMDFVFK